MGRRAYTPDERRRLMVLCRRLRDARDCGKPIDKYMAEMKARLSARFAPGQPIKMPIRCTECMWKAVQRLSEEGPPPETMAVLHQSVEQEKK